MISVLFTTKNSIYKKLGQDCWDIKRDARTWPGGNAIIAHPPCRGWGDYSHMAKHTEEEKQLAIWAIHKIRMWGGILEHPRKSKLWPVMKLGTPAQTDKFGGYSISIRQSWFGHRAEKETLLYIVGITKKELPIIPITFNTITKTIEDMAKTEREHTPIKLAEWLIETVNKIENNKNKTK